MSTSPDCKAVKRSLADSGVYLTLSALPKIAAATARHTSTSIPVQLPFSSGLEKPGSPWLTPHWTKPLRFTSSSVAACARPITARNADAANTAIILPKFMVTPPVCVSFVDLPDRFARRLKLPYAILAKLTGVLQDRQASTPATARSSHFRPREPTHQRRLQDFPYR